MTMRSITVANMIAAWLLLSTVCSAQSILFKEHISSKLCWGRIENTNLQIQPSGRTFVSGDEGEILQLNHDGKIMAVYDNKNISVYIEMYNDGNLIFKTPRIEVTQTPKSITVLHDKKEYVGENLWDVCIFNPIVVKPLNEELYKYIGVKLDVDSVKQQLVDKAGSRLWSANKSTLDYYINQLESDRYQDREDARRMLNKHVPYLKSLDISKMTPEQRMSINSLKKLEAYYIDSPENISDWILYNRNFLIRCLSLEDREIRKAASKQLETILQRQFDYDVDGDYAKQAEKIKELFYDEPDVAAPYQYDSDD